MTEPDTLTIPQFAERAQISLSKAYALAQADELPVPVIRIGRTIRIHRAAYERWLHQFEQHEEQQTA